MNNLLIAFLFSISGIDGFKLLPFARELGGHPFFLIYPFICFSLFFYNKITIKKSAIILIYILIISLIGFMSSYHQYSEFANKFPISQLFFQSALFLIGFTPIFLNTTFKIKEELIVKSSYYALIFVTVFLAIDLFEIIYDLPRFNENIFLGSKGRNFPVGIFSEPSYVAVFYAIFLPLALYRSRMRIIILSSLFFSILFFYGQIRTFFVIYSLTFSLLIYYRIKYSRLKVLFLSSFLFLFLCIIFFLHTFDTVSSLSSAFRLGNAAAFLTYSFENTFFLGKGFGMSHFIYNDLNFNNSITNTEEFINAFSGLNEYRINTFNLWIRLFIEIGILPTIFFSYVVWHKVYKCLGSNISKLFFFGALVSSLTIDSYLSGVLTSSLFFAANIKRRT